MEPVRLVAAVPLRGIGIDNPWYRRPENYVAHPAWRYAPELVWGAPVLAEAVVCPRVGAIT